MSGCVEQSQSKFFVALPSTLSPSKASCGTKLAGYEVSADTFGLGADNIYVSIKPHLPLKYMHKYCVLNLKCKLYLTSKTFICIAAFCRGVSAL